MMIVYHDDDEEDEGDNMKMQYVVSDLDHLSISTYHVSSYLHPFIDYMER